MRATKSPTSGGLGRVETDVGPQLYEQGGKVLLIDGARAAPRSERIVNAKIQSANRPLIRYTSSRRNLCCPEKTALCQASLAENSPRLRPRRCSLSTPCTKYLGQTRSAK